MIRARRAVMVTAVLAAVVLASPGRRDAAANRSAFGDAVTALRLIADWRYEEAREVVARLKKKAPDAVETRYLAAELAFIDGEYERVIALLDGLDDDAADSNVGSLRKLAASTLAVTKSFASRESSGGHFVIHYAPGKDEAIVELAGEVLEAAYRALGDDLGYRPREKVRVEFLSRPADLAELSPLTETEIETTGTIALCKYGKLMVVSPRATLFGYPWMDTLVHEYVHYVVARLSHNKVPVWLHEGLARFEQIRWRKEPQKTLSAMEQHLLATALKNRKLITFEEMHPSMAKLPSQEAAALAFAEVFTMVGFLHERTGYDGIREMIALQREGKSAQRAVAEVLGRPWPRVERDWKAFLRTLDLKPSRTLAGRAAARRIRFDKGGKDSGEAAENVGVDEVASTKARKFARLGGMLRARGMSEAAAAEYEKALAIVGRSDPFVAAKLGRTYLELAQYQKAIDLARPLLAADEGDASPAVTLGLAELALGKLGDARAAFEVALRVSPFDPAVRCSLAEIYDKEGDRVRAERETRACTMLRP